MELKRPLDREECDIIRVIHVPNIRFLACEIISIFPFQIHQKPHIMPHVVILFNMAIKIDIKPIELFSVDITNKASVLRIFIYFFLFSSQGWERINNDTTDDSRNDQIDN